MIPIKYIFQFAVLAGCACCGELLRVAFLPNAPASLLGMAVLFILLCLKILKPQHIREASYFLISIFPLMFVAPTVGLAEHFAEFSQMAIPLFCAIFGTTILCAVTTGKVSQKIIERKSGK